MNAVQARCDVNRNTSNSSDSNLARFRSILKLEEISGLTINSIKSTNVIYVNSSTECTQFDINFRLALNFVADIKITYPRVAFFSDDVVEISKLRINVTDLDIKKEIISCTNYLQRQRNINLALSILKKCALLIAERKLILDLLTLHGEGNITWVVHDDGICIRCEDKRTQFKFFESVWKIHFDCRNHYVVDYIDFSVTTLNSVFHDAAKPTMNMLVQPNVSYNTKVELWWNIVQAVTVVVHQDTSVTQTWGSRDFLRVRSIQEINSIGGGQYEIIESDDEDCIVVEDN